jgi:hypothetical protein
MFKIADAVQDGRAFPAHEYRGSDQRSLRKFGAP